MNNCKNCGGRLDEKKGVISPLNFCCVGCNEEWELKKQKQKESLKYMEKKGIKLTKRGFEIIK
jgi:RNA polymerase-binding transcription factor DksA